MLAWRAGRGRLLQLRRLVPALPAWPSQPPPLPCAALGSGGSSSRGSSSSSAAARRQHRQQQQHHHQQQHWRRPGPAGSGVKAAAAVGSPPQPRGGAEEAFYAEDASSFEELGIAPALAEALRAAGFSRPSRVQELVVPRILAGKDVVLAAETGSGKTLAYIAPIASLLLQRQAAGGGAEAGSSGDDNSSSSRRAQERPLALVLCPNTALCQQVVRLVASLPGASGAPLLRAAHVSGASPPPFEPPDIVAVTPGALVGLFNDRGASYGQQWTAEGVSQRAVAVVVDEADLLFQGSYVKDLLRLLDAMKAGERRQVEAQAMTELGIDKDAFARLPRHIKAACWQGGARAMLKAGFKRGSSRQPQQDEQDQPDQQDPQQQGAELEHAPAQPQPDATAPASSSSNSSSDGGSRGAFVPYFKRQHLFIAATMPSLTKADVGKELQKRFRNAEWVSGDLLHQVKPHVEHAWVRVGSGEGEADSALLDAVTADPDYQAQRARVLVFTRDTASADRVADVLQAAAVPCLRYHKSVPAAERGAALEALRCPAPGANAVLVSTDAAARGIDLPDVTHVVQADFATTAIEFLHRVGRTARAGRAGKVTSLVRRPDAVLADAIAGYVAAGRPVEECFSRNRSFSRKVKRYGRFVPRGQEGPAGDGDGGE